MRCHFLRYHYIHGNKTHHLQENEEMFKKIEKNMYGCNIGRLSNYGTIILIAGVLGAARIPILQMSK